MRELASADRADQWGMNHCARKPIAVRERKMISTHRPALSIRLTPVSRRGGVRFP